MRNVNQSQDYFSEFLSRFRGYSTEELVECFNREVGNLGWGNARAAYLAALRTAFYERDLTLDPTVFMPGATSYKRKIKLVCKVVAVDE
ncbi:hypothetical protein M2480_001315 [Parabacteroides sp. PFB2-12]|uniref:hypothetical protein n=1 Tax=unclassified Parabacteroides TaxID=2649774 RepID=UPI0024764E10|nr:MULTISPECIES: hypothetical protein [unclassified Parabacteroides]MDH6343326.1 hypothetical protein [Parabacteroides sp. PM6-13]MDH6390342.1 hypothetical protein [Parabacteroides sp. PFB2-12]